MTTTDSSDSSDNHDSDREMPRHIATWMGGTTDRAGLAALVELVRAYRRARDAARSVTAMLADAGIGPDEITALPILSYEGRSRVVLRAAPDISENAAAWLRRRDPYSSTEPTQPRIATTKGAIGRSSQQTVERGQPRDHDCGQASRDRANRDTGQPAPSKAWWAA